MLDVKGACSDFLNKHPFLFLCLCISSLGSLETWVILLFTLKKFFLSFLHLSCQTGPFWKKIDEGLWNVHLFLAFKDYVVWLIINVRYSL
jgi:hypothetical protein